MEISQLIEQSTLSEHERNIFSYISNNIDYCLEKGIRTVAKDNFVSTSAIMRIAKKLNFKGYTDMLYDMKYMITHNQMDLLYQNHVSNLMYQNETICEENIKAFFDVLNRQDIFLFGTGYSEIICQYCYKKLIVNGISAYMVNGLEFDTVFNKFHHTIGSVLLISKSGLTPYIVNIAESAKRNGIPVVSFTGNMKSRLKEISDISFVVENGLYYDYDNSEYSPFFGYSIILFENIISSLRDHSANTENT